jgi:2-dehydro-3-deoxyphosphogluconate aldolase/(4S)-4-hydroxy-2-oxoglutarate aldolase
VKIQKEHSVLEKLLMNKLIVNKIKEIKFLPVATVTSISEICSYANKLRNNNINIIEICYRNELASEGIKEVKKLYPDMLIAAGTVRNIAQVKLAISNGADFIVTPGINEAVLKYCLDESIMVIPGCMTPTEFEIANKYGIKLVKLFPAKFAGGVNFIKAVRSPYQDITFIPTGGINMTNIEEYLSLDCVISCGSSMLFKGNINDADYRISRLKVLLDQCKN